MTGGRTTNTDSPDEVMAFTGAGWLGWDENRHTLVRHEPGQRDRTLLTGVTYGPRVVADARGAAVLSTTEPGMRLDLVDLTTNRVETITRWDRPRRHPALDQEWPGEVTLTPRDVVWTGWTDIPQLDPWPDLHRRARAGGPVSTTESPHVYDFQGRIAATDDRVVFAHVIPVNIRAASVRLWSLSGDAWRPIPLPNQSNDTGTPFADDFGGFAADGGGITFALGGDASQTGVYSVGTDAATRVATVPDGGDTISDVSLDNGRLAYGVRAAGAPADRPVQLWRSAVGPDLTLGEPEGLGDGRHARGGAHAAVAQSGGRLTVLGSYFASAVLYSPDGLSFITGAARGDQTLRASGRFVLIGGKVWSVPNDADRPRLDLTAQKCLDTDIFGARIACSRADGSVLLRGAGDTVIQDGISRADGAVAVWGSAVAWHAADGTIAYRARRDGPVSRTPVTGPVRELRFSEGTLSWVDARNRLMLLDLGTMTVHDSGLSAPGMVDDHLVAGLADGVPVVRRLPFGTPHRPRLISSAVPRSFRYPQVWRPEFELTKAVTDVRVTLTRGRKVVATLKGTGTDGDVRGLVWTGRKGTYTWRLTATSRDGEGQLAPVSGTVSMG